MWQFLVQIVFISSAISSACHIPSADMDHRTYVKGGAHTWIIDAGMKQ